MKWPYMRPFGLCPRKVILTWFTFFPNGLSTVLTVIKTDILRTDFQKNVKAGQSGDFLILFTLPNGLSKKENVPNVKVFMRSGFIAQFSVNSSGIASADFFQNHLFAAGLEGNLMSIVKKNTAGEETAVFRERITERNPYYTDGRVFTLIDRSFLYAWVPKNNFFYKFEANLSLVEKVELEIPKEIRNFDPTLIKTFLEHLGEIPKSRPTGESVFADFLNKYHDVVYRQEPIWFQLSEDRSLHLVYDVLKIDRGRADQKFSKIATHVFQHSNGVLAGLNEIEDMVIRGKFPNGRYLGQSGYREYHFLNNEAL